MSPARRATPAQATTSPPPPAPQPPVNVYALLRDSRAAHAEYRTLATDAAKQKRRLPDEMARPLIARALALRQEADAADPGHLDPAWLVDGVSHGSLMAFYQQKLAG